MEAKEMILKIRNTVSKNSTLLSPRPRAMALFTKQRGVFIRPDKNISALDSITKTYSIKYVLAMKGLGHVFIDSITNNQALTEIVWQNKGFKLCRIKE
jgi:hypothetical protein